MIQQGDDPDTVWEHPRVVAFTAPNAGPKTLEGTHTYVIGGETGYVLDPGPNIPVHVQRLISWVTRHLPRPRGVLLTHGHPDHAPAAVEVAARLQVPILASPRLDSSYFTDPPEYRQLLSGDALRVDGDRLETLDTPGHSYDHLSFWLARARILFSGDTILGRGTSLVAPPEGNMAQYMRTLDLLLDLHPRLIAPGHGPMISDPDRTIRQYIEHRREREAQILAALKSRPASIEELVDSLYADVTPRLRELAAGSVAAQLEKLEREGKVIARGPRYRLSDA